MATPTFSNRFVYAISDASRGVGSGAPAGTIPLGTPHVRVPNDEGNGGWVVTYEDLGTAMTQAALESAIAGQGRGVDLTLFQNLTIPGDPPPSGGEDPEPDFELDFGNFATIAAVEDDPNWVFTFGDVTLETEPANAFGLTKAIHCHFPGGAVEEQHGMDFNVPAAMRGKTIAIEIIMGYDDWIDGCSVGSTPCDHKTIFLTNTSGIGRDSVQLRGANDSRDWWGDINGDPDITTFNYPNAAGWTPSVDAWDGSLHRYRSYLKREEAGQTVGIREIWWDDAGITANYNLGPGGVNPSPDPSVVFSKISFSRNGDPGGTSPIIRCARIRAWEEKPASWGTP